MADINLVFWTSFFSVLFMLFGVGTTLYSLYLGKQQADVKVQMDNLINEVKCINQKIK